MKAKIASLLALSLLASSAIAQAPAGGATPATTAAVGSITGGQLAFGALVAAGIAAAASSGSSSSSSTSTTGTTGTR